MAQFLPFGGFASNFVFTDAYLVLRTSLVLGDLVLRTSLVLGDLVLRMSLVLGDLVLRTYLVLGMLQCQEQHVFKYVFLATNTTNSFINSFHVNAIYVAAIILHIVLNLTHDRGDIRRNIIVNCLIFFFK